jgi:hypothetical protein
MQEDTMLPSNYYDGVTSSSPSGETDASSEIADASACAEDAVKEVPANDPWTRLFTLPQELRDIVYECLWDFPDSHWE